MFQSASNINHTSKRKKIQPVLSLGSSFDKSCTHFVSSSNQSRAIVGQCQLCTNSPTKHLLRPVEKYSKNSVFYVMLTTFCSLRNLRAYTCTSCLDGDIDDDIVEELIEEFLHAIDALEQLKGVEDLQLLIDSTSPIESFRMPISKRSILR